MYKFNLLSGFNEDNTFISLAPGSNLPDEYNNIGIYGIAAILRRRPAGDLTVSSKGLEGVVADSTPVSASVYLIQETEGVLVEVAKTESLDGSWIIDQVHNQKTHAIAFKKDFNAGITANIIMDG